METCVCPGSHGVVSLKEKQSEQSHCPRQVARGPGRPGVRRARVREAGPWPPRASPLVRLAVHGERFMCHARRSRRVARRSRPFRGSEAGA